MGSSEMLKMTEIRKSVERKKNVIKDRLVLLFKSSVW